MTLTGSNYSFKQLLSVKRHSHDPATEFMARQTLLKFSRQHNTLIQTMDMKKYHHDMFLLHNLVPLSNPAVWKIANFKQEQEAMRAWSFTLSIVAPVSTTAWVPCVLSFIILNGPYMFICKGTLWFGDSVTKSPTLKFEGFDFLSMSLSNLLWASLWYCFLIDSFATSFNCCFMCFERTH